MDVLLVVDMQAGLLNSDPKHDLAAVIERINRLAADIRERSGTVVFVQHSRLRAPNAWLGAASRVEARSL